MNYWLFLTYTAALLAILNPISTIPYYIALHKSPDDKTVKKDTRIISLAVFLILIISAVSGWIILSFFWLEIAYFKLAWWVLLTFMAYDMAKWKISSVKTDEKEENKAIKHDYMERWLIIPLAMPLTSWPGSIAYVISHTSLSTALTMWIAIFVSSFITYIALRYWVKIQKFLWEIGIKLVTRFMGLILLWLGIQTIVTTLIPLIKA